MYARVSHYDMGGASRDDAVAAFESVRTPLEAMQGNQGGMLLVNPSGEKAMTITLWESEEALRGSEEQANQMRERAAGGAGLTIREIERYEIALDFGTR